VEVGACSLTATTVIKGRWVVYLERSVVTAQRGYYPQLSELRTLLGAGDFH
jgi:hypothetical protein